MRDCGCSLIEAHGQPVGSARTTATETGEPNCPPIYILFSCQRPFNQPQSVGAAGLMVQVGCRSMSIPAYVGG
jgi:hypothetical protein